MCVRLVARLILVLLTPALISGWIPGRGWAQPPTVFQQIEAVGVVLTFERGSQTLSIRRDQPGGKRSETPRGKDKERGRGASRRDAKGHVAFRLVAGTLLDVPGGLSGLTPGTRVRVWAVQAGDDLPVALRITAQTKRKASAPPGEIAGLVLAQSDRGISLLTSGNRILTVLTTGLTRVPVTDGLTRLAVVEVEGTRNSDGSVSAQAIAVRFDPRRATRLTGRIGTAWSGDGFLLAGGAVVSVGASTWILRGTSLRSPDALAAGVGVAVLGDGRLPFVGARVIEILP